MPLPFSLEQTGPTTLLVERGFAAPPARVWRAMTDPALVLQWMGMPDHPITKAEIDLREGGAYRYEWRMPEGGIIGVSGTFRVLEQPGKIVQTELFDEDWTDGETVVTTLLEPVEAGTRASVTIEYRSEQGLHMALQSGMDEGMSSTYDQLDALLAS